MKKTGGIFHDRFIVLDYGTADERVFLCGASSKDAGARITSIVEDYGIAKYNSVIAEDEVEEAIADLKSQVYELKKNQIDADSIYGFLNAFNELYAECTDAEKKQFMQAFIERIDIFQERREDGNWIRNIKFQFPVPILRDGKEVVRVDGISLDKEQSDEHTVTLEKFPTLETVVLLSQLK